MAAAGEIEKALLEAELNPELDAVKFFEPVRLMLKSSNAATPAPSVVRESVPLSMPVPVVKAIVTVTPALGTLLPKVSFNWTVAGGAITTPAMASVGCCTNTN